MHDLPAPQPGEGQVRVRVEAASINPFDSFVIKGFMKDRMEHHFPLIPCSDLAGTVDMVGAGVSVFVAGDVVFGITGRMTPGGGTLAEFTSASATTTAKRPTGLGPVEAAALPLAGVSALMCLDAVAPKAGDVVVVIGASGGIGGYAVQLAHLAGARVVGVTSTQHVEYVQSLGAVDVIDRARGDVNEALRLRYPRGVAAIIDTTSDAPTLARLAEAVASGGAVTSMRGAATVEALAERSIRATNIRTQVTTERLEKLAGSVVAGKLKPGLVHRFELADANRAFDMVGQGFGGKVVVSV